MLGAVNKDAQYSNQISNQGNIFAANFLFALMRSGRT